MKNNTRRDGVVWSDSSTSFGKPATGSASSTRGPRPGRVSKYMTSETPKAVLKHIVIAGFGLIMVYPLIWMFSRSLMENEDIFANAGSGSISLDNYVEGWTALGTPFGRFLLNSIVVAGLSILGNLISCTLAAYAFARLRFRFRKPLFAVMLATLMLPFHVTLIPQYIIFNAVGLTDTYVPLLLPKFLGVEAFFVFLIVQFIRGLPRTLDDSAAIDGCGQLRTFWHIILPLCKPAIGVTTIFTFIWTWNDFLTPLIYLNSPEKYTAAIGLSTFSDSTGLENYGALFAMSVVTLIPVFGVFLFAQRALTQGIATTGFR